jgi:hypothetical protein
MITSLILLEKLPLKIGRFPFQLEAAGLLQLGHRTTYGFRVQVMAADLPGSEGRRLLNWKHAGLATNPKQ